MVPGGSPIDAARRIADDLLFPAALATDAAGAVPVHHLDALADAGLYGLSGPAGAGGWGVDAATCYQVIEVLAGGCLTTTFVWHQHNGAVTAVAGSAARPLREEWLVPLCRGRRRAGIAVAGVRPGAGGLEAHEVSGGWQLHGAVPWVTGWGGIDVVLTGARAGTGDIVWALVDATPSASLSVEPQRLVAVQASATVVVNFDGHFVPDGRVTSIESYRVWASRDMAGLRPNGSLALGLTGRCCRLLGPSSYDDELAACRAALDGAGAATLPAARAAASELALRASAALVVAGGSRSVLMDHQAQRLAREALFLLVFGSRPPIRDAVLELLRHDPPGL